MSRYHYLPPHRRRRNLNIDIPLQSEPVEQTNKAAVADDVVRTHKFLKSKYYPVDYSANVIYNEPHNRECDCSYLSSHTGTIGRKGDVLNKYSAYEDFVVVEIESQVSDALDYSGVYEDQTAE